MSAPQECVDPKGATSHLVHTALLVQPDNQSALDSIHLRSKVALRLEAPLAIPDDPHLEPCYELIGRDVKLGASRRETSFVRLKACDELCELRADAVDGSLKVTIFRCFQERQEVVTLEANCLLPIVRI